MAPVSSTPPIIDPLDPGESPFRGTAFVRPAHAFDVDPWALVETGFDRGALGRAESLFTVSNGHLGLRGNLDEAEPRDTSGTYLNGFYENYRLEYGERAFGFPEDGQSVVPVTDGKVLRVLVEDEPLDLQRGTIEHQSRRLDLRTGILERELVWRSAYGEAVRIRSRRLVSFVQRSVAVIEFTVEALERPLRIGVQSLLIANDTEDATHVDPRVGRQLETPLEPQLAVASGMRAVLAHRTRRSQLAMAAGMDHRIACEGENAIATDIDCEDDLARVMLTTRLAPETPLTITKFLAYHWSSRQTKTWLRDQVDASLQSAIAEGFDGLAQRQRTYLDDFWARADVEVEGDDELQQAARFAMYTLLQAGARGEGRALGAKGLTGTGYDGHAFWDTEAFALPVLSYTQPRIVRDALLWRARTLPQARRRARMFGLEGASFPWRTIHGEECSGYWPAGVAAAHVNADIADAVRRYVAATGDVEFEAGPGLDLLVETARFWLSLGAIDRHGAFRIDGVTGPDEYSALVNNNVFTNLMAQRNLEAAADAVEHHPQAARERGVRADEVPQWRAAASAMYVPWDDQLGIHPQDEGFLDQEVWDFEGTADDEYPLLLNHPYFHLYRKQVVKQADLVLALHVCGDSFDDTAKRRNFAHYEPLTVRDSSLSAGTQSVVAAEVGHLDLAYDYLREALLTDFEDLHANSSNGLHLAAMAGGLLAVTNGVGGFRDHPNCPWAFKPRLIGPLTRVAFRLTLAGTRLRIEVGPEEATYVNEGEREIDVEHYGEVLTVGAEPVVRAIPAPATGLIAPSQPRGRAPRRR